MARVAAAAVALGVAFLALPLTAAGAQRAGESWRPLIPGLKAQLNAQPDPEVALRLSLVYAHEGLLIDWWHMLKQLDRMIGGEGRREALGREIMAGAAANVKRDPGNLLARYELAFASWFVERDHHTAMHEFLEITRQEPRNAMNHGYLGYLYADRQDVKNTIAQWEDGVRLDPGNSAIRYLLGTAYNRTGRTRDAAIQFALAYKDRTVYNYVTRGELP
jgi:tetratricopeptide (TPR) repeat protein